MNLWDPQKRFLINGLLVFLVASPVYKDTNLPIDEHCRYKDFFVIDDFILLQFFVLKELLVYVQKFW